MIEDELFEEGWVDGLPVVLPTEQRVEDMLCATNRKRDETIGYVEPMMGVATVEKAAINSVMAGCKPAYFSVVLAGLEAVIDEHFNLNGIQTTTHCAAPLMVVNGPIRKEIELNCGSNVFGQGFRANATIGRALRFLLMNIGGGIPRTMDKSTFGHPGKFTFCIGENRGQMTAAAGVGPNAVNLMKISLFTPPPRQKPGPEELEQTGFLLLQE